MLMAKRINPNELVGYSAVNKKGHKFTVVSYLRKDKDYIYKVRFNSGNIIEATRQQIIKFTLRDRETEKKENQKKKFTDYKRMNKDREKPIIFVDDKSKVRLLSIDQSTRASGWAVFYDNELVDCGVFTQKSSNTIERIYNMKEEVNSIIDKHNINMVVVEDIFLGKSLNLYKVLSFLLGVLCVLFYEKRIPYEIIRAVEWKSYHKILRGDRNIQKMLSKKKIGADSDDLSDALLLGMYVWNDVIIESDGGW